MEIRDLPSPNFGPRKGGGRPCAIILHHTAMASAEAACRRLADPEAEVSAHYVIGEDGALWEMVAPEARAWHAGRSFWQGETDLNSWSIGIEICNPGPLTDHPPFTEAAMAALEALLDLVMSRWAIPPHGVLGHSDIAIGRKSDPGHKFDWARLARAGLAAARPGFRTVAPDADGFRQALAAIGYDPDAADDERLRAFRLRWRPDAVPGPFDAADMGLATALAAIDRPPLFG